MFRWFKCKSNNVRDPLSGEPAVASVLRQIDGLNMGLHVFTYCRGARIDRSCEVSLSLARDGMTWSAKAEGPTFESALMMAWGIWLCSPLAKLPEREVA